MGERCNLSSNTCADYQRCEGVGIAGDDLCLNQAGGRCVGSKAVNCDSAGTSYFIDCAKASGLCRVSGTGSNSFAECEVVSTCSETDAPQTHCNGTFSYVCRRGGIGYGPLRAQGFATPKMGCATSWVPPAPATATCAVAKSTCFVPPGASSDTTARASDSDAPPPRGARLVSGARLHGREHPEFDLRRIL